MGASVLAGSKDAAGGGGGGGGGGNVDTPAEEKGQSVPLPSALHTHCSVPGRMDFGGTASVFPRRERDTQCCITFSTH